MGYHTFGVGDLVGIDGNPYIIYTVEYKEAIGPVYGVLESKRRYSPDKLKYVPRETIKMWKNPSTGDQR